MVGFDLDVTVVHARDSWSSPVPTLAVLDALSEIEDVSPLELDFLLYDHVDPEALDSLVSEQRDGGVEIQFSVGGRYVRIDAESITISHENNR